MRPASLSGATVGHVSWTAPMPAECPHGHQLGPGRVLVRFRKCTCPGARTGTMGGHILHECDACRAEGWQTIRFWPWHVSSHQAVRLSAVAGAPAAGPRQFQNRFRHPALIALAAASAAYHAGVLDHGAAGLRARG